MWHHWNPILFMCFGFFVVVVFLKAEREFLKEEGGSSDTPNPVSTNPTPDAIGERRQEGLTRASRPDNLMSDPMQQINGPQPPERPKRSVINANMPLPMSTSIQWRPPTKMTIPSAAAVIVQKPS